MTTAATSKYRAWALISMPGCSVRAGSASSCHVENRKAAPTPMDTSVSIVEARCRALTAAARWKGQAAQVTTGRLRANAHQPQFGNCAAGIMEMMSTGSVRAAASSSRGRSAAAAAGSSPESSATSVPSSGRLRAVGAAAFSRAE